MRRVIFLDIDGVLNSREWRKANPFQLRREAWEAQIDPGRLDRFDGIFRTCNPSEHNIEDRPIVVLSSTWRFHWTLAEMTEIFAVAKNRSGSAGNRLLFTFHSTTPSDTIGRIDGIYAWLKTHGQKDDRWIVIDDDPVCEEFGEHWIRIADGLESRHVVEAVDKLGYSKIYTGMVIRSRRRGAD